MKYALGTAIAALLVSAAVAQQPMDHNHGAMGGSESSGAYMQSMKKMNEDMGKPMSGDADKDFAAMMIPHHQGAIDMAKIELQHGKDPMLKKMAAKIIKDQEREIREMKAWLAKQK